MKPIKTTVTAFICILLSSCIILRKKAVVKALAHVDPEPKAYCFTVKTKITDILSVSAKTGNQASDQNFMFDTGSPLTYSFKTKDSFNIESKKYFRIGSSKFDYGKGPFNFGNVTFNNAGFIVTDYILDEYKEVDGLIGSSLLQTSICELNFADSTIKVSNDLANFTNIQNSYSGSFEPSAGQGTPIVKIVIGKDTLTGFIDTGFSGLIKFNSNVKLPPEAAGKREWYRNVKYSDGSKKDRFVNGAYYQVHRLGVAGLQLDSLTIWQDPKYYGRNLIGLAFLKKFIVTIDWVHHRIYFKPVNNIRFRQIYTYGFTCWMHDRQLRVLDLYKGSELEKAGVKSGDVIVSINKIKDFSEAMISNINSNTPDNVPIQLEIENKRVITLKKGRLFDQAL